MGFTTLQSDTIRFLRFPLILGVLFAHASASELVVQGQHIGLNDSYFYLELIERLFADLLGGVRVPFFFFVAGLLFFRKYKQSENNFYKQQFQKRIHSLFIPYLFWNFLLILLFLIAQSTPILRELFSGNNTKIADYGIHDFITAFGIGSRFPINFQFWFLRDLLALTLSAPLLAYLIRKTKLLPIALFFMGWILETTVADKHLMMASYCFFSLGAYFSIQQIDVLAFSHRYRHLINTLFLGYCALYVAFPTSPAIEYTAHVSILAGIFSLFNLTSELLKRIHVPQKWYLLSDMSFFLFAIHEPFLGFLKKALFITLQPQQEWMLITLFLLPPLFITACAYISYQHVVPYLPTKLKQVMGLRPSPATILNREVAGRSPKLSTPS